MESAQAEAVRYYDAIFAEYDEMVAADRGIREAFQQLVFQSVPSGSLLFDFGCGTGIDAAAYAERGYRVLAWDPSARMREQAVSRCEDHVRNGRVMILSTYGPKLSPPNPAAITANFGVTSLIADLEWLFRDWAQYLDVGGVLLLSIQNPWFLGDMQERWWWRGLPQLLARGEFHVHGSQVYRRRRSFLSKVAAPHFEEKSRTFSPFSKFCFLVYQRCQP